MLSLKSYCTICEILLLFSFCCVLPVSPFFFFFFSVCKRGEMREKRGRLVYGSSALRSTNAVFNF